MVDASGMAVRVHAEKAVSLEKLEKWFIPGVSRKKKMIIIIVTVLRW